jgi:hypothetical protein
MPRLAASLAAQLVLDIKHTKIKAQKAVALLAM